MHVGLKLNCGIQVEPTFELVALANENSGAQIPLQVASLNLNGVKVESEDGVTNQVEGLAKQRAALPSNPIRA